MHDYQSGYYLGLRLTKEQDQRLKDMAAEMVNWYPAKDYPLSKEEVFSLLIVLGYHMESMFWPTNDKT